MLFYTLLLGIYLFAPVGEKGDGLVALVTFIVLSFIHLFAQVALALINSTAENATKDGLGVLDVITTIFPGIVIVIYVTVAVMSFGDPDSSFAFTWMKVLWIGLGSAVIGLDLCIGILGDRARRRVREVTQDR
jgi:hypothetical protein